MSDVVGEYSEGSGWETTLTLDAGGTFQLSSVNSGFAGKQGSGDRGRWTLVDEGTIELHATEHYTHYEDTNDYESDAKAIDTKQLVTIKRNWRGRVVAIVVGDSELPRKKK